MRTRKRAVGADSRGRHYTEVGRKVTASGKIGTHRFLLGSDEAEANHRADRLKMLWEQTVAISGPEVTWNALTLDIGSQIAQGKPPREGRPPEEFTRWFHRVARTYPFLVFVPASVETYAKGASLNRELVESEINRITTVAKRVGKLTDLDVDRAASGSLHQALDEYTESINREGVRLESH